jgi:hypothetical protein
LSSSKKGKPHDQILSSALSSFFDIEYFRSPHGPCVCGKDRRRWSDRVVVPVSLWVYSPAWAPDPDPKHPAKASDHSVVVRLMLHKKWHQREDSNTATALAQYRPSPPPTRRWVGAIHNNGYYRGGPRGLPTPARPQTGQHPDRYQCPRHQEKMLVVVKWQCSWCDVIMIACRQRWQCDRNDDDATTMRALMS